MDPVLKHSVKKYSDFVGVLHSCGLVKFCQSAKVTNGLFFVRKKSGKLRMILDAWPANQLFRKAPTGQNGSAASFGELRQDPGVPLYIAQYDVKDYFTDWVSSRSSDSTSGSLQCLGMRSSSM